MIPRFSFDASKEEQQLRAQLRETVTARMEFLTTYNGMKISKSERADAERLYV